MTVLVHFKLDCPKRLSVGSPGPKNPILLPDLDILCGSKLSAIEHECRNSEYE